MAGWTLDPKAQDNKPAQETDNTFKENFTGDQNALLLIKQCTAIDDTDSVDARLFKLRRELHQS